MDEDVGLESLVQEQQTQTVSNNVLNLKIINYLKKV